MEKCPPPPPYRRLSLHRPEPSAVVACLDRACRAAFVDASVELIDHCPDLSAAPFRLAGRGLGSDGADSAIASVGGVPYLLPTPQVETRRYDLRTVLTAAGFPDGLILGAGAVSSAKFGGRNAELVANLGPLGNGCRVASIHADQQLTGLESCQLSKVDFAESGLMTDALCSGGQSGGPLIRLRASRWRSQQQGQSGEADSSNGEGRGRLAELLQRALAKEFSGCDLPVGIGGAFCLSGSPAHMHVMPDFSSTPLTCPAEVNSWLRFFDMPPPLVCCGVLLSHDPRSWGLRLEHFHGWNTETEACGGHYHYDSSPDTAEYEAYFTLASWLLRMDPPAGVEALSDA